MSSVPLDGDGPTALEMRGITKRFPGVLANDAVDLTVRVGEVHGLLGENGAGKSTLMNVLSGLYRPDAGEISIAEPNGDLRDVQIASPRKAIDLGVGMVHQHFKLVPTQTVAENVLIGLRGVPFRLDMEDTYQELADLADLYHLPVDPRAYIWQLSVGEQQRVEILKMLRRGAQTLILDEPTAVLTPQEAADLGDTLEAMATAGKAIIFISHKLNEVMTIAHQVTVLRAGRNVATVPVADTSKEELATLMVGRRLAPVVREEPTTSIDDQPEPKGEPALSIRALDVLNDRELPALQDVTLEVRGGEILGIAGVAGNGQQELVEVVTGLRQPTAGMVTVGETDITGATPRRIIDLGVSHIPGDRLGVGLAGNLSLSDNLAMKMYRRHPLSRGPFLRRREMTTHATKLVSAFDISTPGPATPVRNLSGGNQQKAILAREITLIVTPEDGDQTDGQAPRVLVASHPTRGLDVGAVESVQGRLLDERGAGTAILLVSEDLDELLILSDRIAVLYDGEVMGVRERGSTTAEELGFMMTGGTPDTTPPRVHR